MDATDDNTFGNTAMIVDTSEKRSLGDGGLSKKVPVLLMEIEGCQSGMF